MFLVACNPEYESIRYIVITSFAVLGRWEEAPKDAHSDSLQRILDLAISSLHEMYKEDFALLLTVLLQFSVAKDKEL